VREVVEMNDREVGGRVGRVVAAPEAVRREQILSAAFAVAARQGLGGVTIRAVATEARMSHALILFYFERKERLLLDLLDWLIAATSAPNVSEDIARFPRALDRLHALLQQEMTRLAAEPRRTRLFLEYWAMGARHAQVGARVSDELERYRSTFRAVMESLREAEPDTFVGMTADGLASVAVSWVQGCAVQAMNDPDRFDIDEYLAVVRGMVGQLAGRG
jgi:TetR/AcrR family transcriptional regulator, transcriptional repressor of bet genes